MSKKHYEKFAAIIRGEISLCEHAEKCGIASNGRGIVVNIARSTADMFAQDSDRFDRERFYEACGMRVIEATKNSKLWG